MSTHSEVASPPGVGLTRRADTRAARRLEYFTVGWNLSEAAVGIASGILAGSVALVGFGFDSVIESLSGMALLWRLRSYEVDRERELRTLRWVGISFFALAAYVGIDASLSLIGREPPDPSRVGIALAIVSLVVMPILARAKRRAARRLESAALEADSRQTDLCAYLSAILLAGLILNATLDWWWADPAAALLMVPIIAREGLRAFRGRACDDCGCSPVGAG